MLSAQQLLTLIMREVLTFHESRRIARPAMA